MQIALASEVVEAWIVTIDRQVGIFDRRFDQQAIKQAHNMGDSEALADDSLIEVVSDIDDLQAHHLWINFLLETWQVVWSQETCNILMTNPMMHDETSELQNALLISSDFQPQSHRLTWNHPFSRQRVSA